MDRVFKNLVLGGGGAKGLAYVGAKRFIEEHSSVFDLKNFAGCSVGSFFCMLFVLGYTSAQIERVALNFEFSKLLDLDIKSIGSTFSLDTSRNVTRFVTQFLLSKGLGSDATFKDLQLFASDRKLHVIAYNLTKSHEVLFNNELTPDMSVVKAIVASMSIPGVFAAVKINGDIHVDGVLSRNMPLTLFESASTLGIYLKTTEESAVVESDPSILDFFGSLTRAISLKGQRLELELAKSSGYTVVEFTFTENASLDFEMSREKKTRLVQLGYDTMITVLQPPAPLCMQSTMENHV